MISSFSNNSENSQSRLKQRLVGALVLIALAVIIVPMVIDFRKDYDQVIQGTNIPSKPDNFHVEILPIHPPRKLQSEAVGSNNVSEKKGPINPQTSQQTTTASPNKQAKPGASAVVTTLSEPEAWIIQVASFSNEKNALELRNSLRGKGYKTSVDELEVESQQVWRVRVGPELVKSRAEALRDKLETETQLKAIVVKY